MLLNYNKNFMRPKHVGVNFNQKLYVLKYYM